MGQNGNGNKLRLSDGKDDVRVLLARHRELYIEEYGHLCVLGDPTLPLPRAAYMQRIFRDLQQVRESTPHSGDPDQDSVALELRRQRESECRPVHEAQVVAHILRPRQRALIVGDGGNGKTEFTRNLAYILARDMFGHGPTPIVPLRVELKNLKIERGSHPSESSSEPLLERLRQTSEPLRVPLDGGALFDQLVHAGQLVLILDGVDEIESDTRPHFEKMLTHAVRQGALADCAIVLTGRTNAISGGIAGLAEVAFHYQPQPLPSRDMERYIRVYFKNRDVYRGRRLVQALHSAAPGVRDLLGWPLMLALTCVRWEAGDITLPEAPTELMRSALLTLLERRAPKGRHAVWATQAMDGLSRLAQRVCPGFERITLDTARAAVGGASRLDTLVQRSGLLFGSPGNGYHISIRPIAEYLAGLALSQQEPAEICRVCGNHIWDGRWEQPLFWMAGELWRNQQGRRVAAHLLSRIIEERQQCNDVLDTLLGRTLVWLSAVQDQSLHELEDPAEEVFEQFLKFNAPEVVGAPRITVQRLPRFVRHRLAGEWLTQLCDDDPRVRWHAALTLGRIGSELSVDALIERLDPEREPDTGVQYCAAMALGKIGSERAVDALIVRLDPERERNVHMRAFAVEALGEIGSERAVDALIERLDPKWEPEGYVQRCAAVALGEIGCERAVDSLIVRLDPEREPDSNMQYCAAEALGKIGSERAVDALLALLECFDPERDRYDDVRMCVKGALGAIRPEHAVHHLMDQIDPGQKSDDIVRDFPLRGDVIGPECGVDVLLERLDPKREPQADLRRHAAYALDAIGSERALAILLRFGWVRMAAETWLRRGCHVFANPNDEFCRRTEARVLEMPSSTPIDFDKPNVLPKRFVIDKTSAWPKRFVDVKTSAWPKRFAIVEASRIRVHCRPPDRTSPPIDSPTPISATVFTTPVQSSDTQCELTKGEQQATQVDPATLAIAILIQEPDISSTELAKRVGVTRSTLYKSSPRWRGVAQTLRARREAKKNFPKGQRSANGGVEAEFESGYEDD